MHLGHTLHPYGYVLACVGDTELSCMLQDCHCVSMQLSATDELLTYAVIARAEGCRISLAPGCTSQYASRAGRCDDKLCSAAAAWQII